MGMYTYKHNVHLQNPVLGASDKILILPGAQHDSGSSPSHKGEAQPKSREHDGNMHLLKLEINL